MRKTEISILKIKFGGVEVTLLKLFFENELRVGEIYIYLLEGHGLIKPPGVIYCHEYFKNGNKFRESRKPRS